MTVTQAPGAGRVRRWAVVGAGMAGLTCARALYDAGQAVVVFDKARGPGGRVSTRRTPDGAFDHGAQVMVARHAPFQQQLADWAAAGLVAPWAPRPGPPAAGDASAAPGGWVGVPRMSAVTRALSVGLEARWGTRVASLGGRAGAWRLTSDVGVDLGHFDGVLVAVPAPQAAPLLAAVPALRSRAAGVIMQPCWTALVHLPAGWVSPWDAAQPAAGPLAWIARQASRPGRGPAPGWVLQATPGWSEAHLEATPASVAAALVATFRAQTGAPAPRWAVAHRWRYASVAADPHRLQCPPAAGGGPAPGEDAAAAWDRAAQIGVCGDWLLGPTVEDAWRSGRALAAAVLAGLNAG